MARPSIARHHAALPRMEETPPPAAEVAPEPAPAPPPAPMEEEGIDLTKYSITITLGVVFVIAKVLDYFGIIDAN